MNKKNKGFTTIELITSFTLASVIMLILFNIILILKDNLSKVNAKTNMLVNKDNLSYNINKRFKEKELSSVTMCDEGDKCYEFTYSDDTSDKLVYSNTDKTITFNNYTFDIIDGITVEEPTITEHYDTMSSTTYNGYFIIHIPIKLDNKDYSIKINKHFNTDSVMVEIGSYYYDNERNRYTKVEYLESTGEQWIDTRYETNINTQIQIDFSVVGYYSGGANANSSILGDFNTDKRGYQLVYLRKSESDDSQFNIVFRASNDTKLTNLQLSLNTRHKALLKNGTLIFDDIEYNSGNYNSPGHYTLGLFTRNSTSGFSGMRKSVMKLYSFKISEGNDLIINFIPVIDSNSRPCMFDKVSRECYYNQGEGEFLYG